MIEDELVHLIKNIVMQVMGDSRPWVYAHIASYDPATHTARVVVPCMRDEVTDKPVVSGWLQIGTTGVGQNVGVQYAPIGGATADNPTAGEQCLVAINEHRTGVASIVCLFYTNTQSPPSPALQAPLAPGEVVIQCYGSTIQLYKSGKIVINSANSDIDINSTTGAVNITAENNVNLTSTSGIVNIAAGQKVQLSGGALAVARNGDSVVNGRVVATSTLTFSG